MDCPAMAAGLTFVSPIEYMPNIYEVACASRSLLSTSFHLFHSLAQALIRLDTLHISTSWQISISTLTPICLTQPYGNAMNVAKARDGCRSSTTRLALFAAMRARMFTGKTANTADSEHHGDAVHSRQGKTTPILEQILRGFISRQLRATRRPSSHQHRQSLHFTRFKMAIMQSLPSIEKGIGDERRSDGVHGSIPNSAGALTSLCLNHEDHLTSCTGHLFL